jgi:hypothetical protein
VRGPRSLVHDTSESGHDTMADSSKGLSIARNRRKTALARAAYTPLFTREVLCETALLSFWPPLPS